MRTTVPSAHPHATLRLLILGIVSLKPTPANRLPELVGLVGGGWTPTRELVFAAVADLAAAGCLTLYADAVAITDQVQLEIHRLIGVYDGRRMAEADVIACSTASRLLPPGQRDGAHRLLAAHWQAQHDWWREASDLCPCQVPSVRTLFRRRMAEALSELGHLDESAAADLR